MQSWLQKFRGGGSGSPSASAVSPSTPPGKDDLDKSGNSGGSTSHSPKSSHARLPTPTAAASDLPPISASALASHKTEESGQWMAVDGVVYDVSTFDHPGGLDYLLKGVGRDATLLVRKYHAHVNVPKRLGVGRRLGRLAADDDKELVAANAAAANAAAAAANAANAANAGGEVGALAASVAAMGVSETAAAAGDVSAIE
ncbi:hypothetical protein BC831DRAFT_553528 [Entophlyctis helioformis]|nr:hypothetical protein BC831DRAFT_553528 [Entophlyctis helioformis]